MLLKVKDLRYDDEGMVSRSQAKHLLHGCEQCEHIVLDFEGIDFIGQGFADEVFRVFVSKHPAVRLEVINARKAVLNMMRMIQNTRF